MYRKLLIIVSLVCSFQTFAGSENYVPMFKVAQKTIETKADLERYLAEDLNHLKMLFKKSNSIAISKNVTQIEEKIFNKTSF